MQGKKIEVDNSNYSLETAKENASCIASFMNFAKVLNWSAATQRTYEVTLRQYYNYMGQEDKAFLGASSSDILGFMAQVCYKYKPNTKRFKLSVLRSFYEHLIEIGLTSNQIVKDRFYPKQEQRIYSTVPLDVFEEFVKYLNEVSSFSVVASVYLMRYAGLRVGETLGLDLIKDIKELGDGRLLVIVRGKGGKIREVPVLNVKATKWLKRARELYGGTEWGLKINTSEQVVNYHAKQFCEKNEIEDFSPHDFRRSFARHLMELTKNVEVVRQMLGHTSYNTTLIYLQEEQTVVHQALESVAM